MDNSFDALIQREGSLKKKIRVPVSLSNPHPLIRESSPIIRKFDEFNSYVVYKYSCLDIITTKKLHTRSLRIMNALLKALEKRSFPVEVTKLVRPVSDSFRGKRGITPSKTGVHIHGLFVEFGIEEQYSNVQVKDTRHSWLDRLVYERQPIGLLSLSIKNINGSGLRQNWREGKRRPAEDSLNSFVIGLIKAAEYLHRQKVEREQREEEWRQIRVREEEARKQKEKDLQVEYDLTSRIADWKKANEIRKFVEVVRKSALVRNENVDNESEIDIWIQSSLDYATRLEKDAVDNVLKKRKPKIHGF